MDIKKKKKMYRDYIEIRYLSAKLMGLAIVKVVKLL